jgi:hypothetical protein
MMRRSLLSLAVSAVGRGMPASAQGRGTLAAAPIEVVGDWGGSLPGSALTVVTRMRAVSLAGVRLLSDRQPGRLRVDSHTSGSPAVWLHYDGTPIAWVIVDIGPRDWSKLAYQFGHELGHVLCNLWRPDAHSPQACAWLEEALVEAFSIRGLGLLADSWATDPPFSGDAAFAGAIRRYRDDLLTKYRTAAAEQGAAGNLAAWYRAQRGALESDGDIGGPARGAVLALLNEFTADPGCIEGLGALYRWPDADGMSMDEYPRRWKRSCAELEASQRLPIRVQELLLG